MLNINYSVRKISMGLVALMLFVMMMFAYASTAGAAFHEADDVNTQNQEQNENQNQEFVPTNDTSPGVPDTGAGGEASGNISLVLGGAALTTLGLTYFLARKQRGA